MGKLKLNSAGVRRLLKSNEILSSCRSVAGNLMKSDSGEHSMNTRIGKSRCNAEIVLKGTDAIQRKDMLV